MYNDLKSTRKEAVETYFQALSHHLPEGTEENAKTKFEVRTFNAKQMCQTLAREIYFYQYEVRLLL